MAKGSLLSVGLPLFAECLQFELKIILVLNGKIAEEYVICLTNEIEKGFQFIIGFFLLYGADNGMHLCLTNVSKDVNVFGLTRNHTEYSELNIFYVDILKRL